VKPEGVVSAMRSQALLQKFAMFGGASVLRTLVAQSYQRTSPSYLGHVHQPWLHEFFVGMFADVALPENLLGEDSEVNPTVNLAHALVMEHFGHMEPDNSNVTYGLRCFGAFGAVSVTLTRHHKQLSCLTLRVSHRAWIEPGEWLNTKPSSSPRGASLGASFLDSYKFSCCSKHAN
jgi:hypothetical protein